MSTKVPSIKTCIFRLEIPVLCGVLPCIVVTNYHFFRETCSLHILLIVNFTLEHAMMAQKGSRGIALHIL
jgi:hypothetical protein